MTARASTSVAVRRAISLPHVPVWIVGWLVSRIAVIAIAVAMNWSAATFDLWDGHWYLRVAEHGYLLVPGRQSDPAFFPLFPITLRGVHALGLSWALAGPIVSNAALLVGLVLFYALTREVMGDAIARRATTYLAIFPLGFVFSMAYPESLALILIAAAPLAALRRRWALAAACAAAAGLTRPEAAFLVLPLATIAWNQRRELGPLRGATAAAATFAPVAAIAAFCLYLSTVLNNPMAWTQAERKWGRNFRIDGLFTAFSHLPHAFSQGWASRDVVFFVLYVILLVAAWRAAVPRMWIAAGVGVVVLPVFSGAFTSDARFGLLAPPLFWSLASLTEDRRAHRAVVAASLALLVLGTVSWRYVFP